MKSKPIATSLAFLIACALGVTQSLTQAADLSAADSKFIKQTADKGMAEVKLAELGTQKAERADVKEFATMMVADHSKANAELAALAKSKDVEVSAIIPPKGAESFKELENQSGKDFDKAFLNHMEKCHKDSIANFEEAEKDAKDGELKAWVSKTLPTLKHHLEKVKELQSK